MTAAGQFAEADLIRASKGAKSTYLTPDGAAKARELLGAYAPSAAPAP